MKHIPFLVFLHLVFFATTCAASGLEIHCGSDLVTPGYLKFEVLQTCGEPLSREMVGEVEIFDTDRIFDRRYSR